MVRDRKGLRGPGVEQFTAELLADGEQFRAPQRAIDMDRAVHGRHAVFREHDDASAIPLRVRNDLAADAIHGSEVGCDRGMVRPDALQTVIQMRQIDQRERRLAGLAHVDCGSRDPFARRNRCGWPPEGEQRERTEQFRQFIPQFGGRRIAVRQLAAVRAVDWARGDAEVRARIHIVPPEHVGAGEVRVARLCGVPHLFAADERVRLTPEPDLR